MQNRVVQLLKYLIGWPFTFIASFFLIKVLFDKLPEVLPHLEHLNLWLLSFGFVLLVGFYFLRSYVWFRIVKEFGATIVFKKSNYYWATSEFKRYIPGSIWSFFGRSVLFSKVGMQKKDIAKCLVIEAELFVIGSAIVSLFALPFIFIWFSEWYGWICGIILGGLCLAYAYNTFIFRKQYVILPKFRPGETLKLIGISTLALFIFGLGNYFLLVAAVSTNPQLIWQLIGVIVLAFVLGYLSLLTPAGFGVREGIGIYFLTRLMPLGIATFVMIFTRVVLILAEVVFIVLSYLWFKVRSSQITHIEVWLRQRPYTLVVWILSACYTIYFSVISILRYDNFFTGRFDLGNMAQTVWNTLHGRIFLFTNPNGTEPISRLAFHADFILVLLAPIYWFWQDPRMLLIIQSIILAIGAYFVFIIAKTVLKHNPLALSFAFAYLINPSLQRSNLYDFHPVTLATTFLLATYYFYLKKKYIFFLLFAFLAGLCKEEVWIIIALFGVLEFVHHKKRVVGAAIFTVSVAIFYFLFFYAIPKSLGSQHFALAYLSDFGDSPSKIFKTFIFSPQKLVQTVNDPQHIHYMAQLFSPLGYVSLAFPFFIIFAMPDLAINLLSNNSQLHQIYYQYTATITPFIFLCGIYGVWVLRRYMPKIPKFVFVCYILFASLFATYSFGPLPGSKEPNIDMITKPLADREYIATYLSHIPKRYSVSTTNNVGSHLSQRQKLYTLPLGVDKADLIIFLLDETQSPNTVKTEHNALDKIRADKQYLLTVNKGNFFVFINLKDRGPASFAKRSRIVYHK